MVEQQEEDKGEEAAEEALKKEEEDLPREWVVNLYIYLCCLCESVADSKVFSSPTPTPHDERACISPLPHPPTRLTHIHTRTYPTCGMHTRARTARSPDCDARVLP